MSNGPSIDYSILQQASQWYAILRSDDVSDGEQRAWQKWLTQDPQHQQAWAVVERISQRFGPLQRGAERERSFRLLHDAPSGGVGRRQVMLSIGGMAVVGVLGLSLARRPLGISDGLARLRSDYSTAIGEINGYYLEDGSHVWLASASGLDVSYTPTCSVLELHCGEVLVETPAVRADYQYLVSVEAGRIATRGGALSIRVEGGSARLAVLTGAAEVATGSGSARLSLSAGQQVRFDSAGFDRVVPVSPGVRSWSRGLLVVDGDPLGNVVAELSRYFRGHIGCDPRIADLRVVGSFPLRNIDRAIEMLQSALPVRAQRTLPWWVTLEGYS